MFASLPLITSNMTMKVTHMKLCQYFIRKISIAVCNTSTTNVLFARQTLKKAIFETLVLIHFHFYTQVLTFFFSFLVCYCSVLLVILFVILTVFIYLKPDYTYCLRPWLLEYFIKEHIKHYTACVISGFHRGVVDIFTLLWCYEA
jgi:hypothetical protein